MKLVGDPRKLFLFALKYLLITYCLVLSDFVEILNGPAFEFIGNGKVFYEHVDLRIQVLQFDHFFGAVFILPFGAVIVNVVMDVTVLLPLHFLLSRYHCSAIPASHQSREGETMGLRPRLAIFAKNFLYAIEFLFGDHRLVRAFIELRWPAVGEPAVIKGVGKYLIEIASAQRF